MRPSYLLVTLPCLLSLASASLASRPSRTVVPSPSLRRGAGFQDSFLLGNLKSPTVKMMLDNRQITWRQVEPFDRVRSTLDVLANDRDWRNRRAAVDDLMFHPSERVEEGLLMALRDPMLGVRNRAAVALGEIGTHRSILPLINALDHTPGPTRDTIGWSLYRLTRQRYGRHRDRWLRWYQANEDLLR